MASRFKGASTAQSSEHGTKCSDGKHLLKIKRITFSEGGKFGDYYVVETEVLQSDSVNDENGRQKDKPGDERVWTQNMAKTSFPLGKLNAFVEAAAGYNRKNAQDKADFDANIKPGMEDVLDATLDESDPLGFVGRTVWALVKWGKTDKGFDFPEHSFSPGDKDRLL